MNRHFVTIKINAVLLGVTHGYELRKKKLQVYDLFSF